MTFFLTKGRGLSVKDNWYARRIYVEQNNIAPSKLHLSRAQPMAHRVVMERTTYPQIHITFIPSAYSSTLNE